MRKSDCLRLYEVPRDYEGPAAFSILLTNRRLPYNSRGKRIIVRGEPSRREAKDVSVTEELIKNNTAYAEGFDKGELPLPPAKKVAVVACMDARLDGAQGPWSR